MFLLATKKQRFVQLTTSLTIINHEYNLSVNRIISQLIIDVYGLNQGCKGAEAVGRSGNHVAFDVNMPPWDGLLGMAEMLNS